MFHGQCAIAIRAPAPLVEENAHFRLRIAVGQAHAVFLSAFLLNTGTEY
jgi:hypothetical protein